MYSISQRASHFLFFSDLLFDAFRHYLLHDRVQVLPRKATSSYQVLYAVGGMSRREATKSAERYDPKEGRWKAIGIILLLCIVYD